MLAILLSSPSMSSVSERHRNNVRAGVFVSVSLIASMVVLIVLSDAVSALGRSTETYTVTFDVASGVANLKPGSDVRVGGVRTGRVISVEPRYDETPFRTIDVEFKLDHRITIYSNAVVVVSTPIIGSDAWLDIPNVGGPPHAKPVNGLLVGTPSVGLLTTLLGSENAGKANEMVENARVFTNFLADVPDEYASRVAPAIDNINSVAGSAKVVMDDLRETHWPSWADSVDKVMTWAAGATGKLDGAIAEGHGLLAETRSVVSENRDPIKATIANLESVTNRANLETVDKVHRILDSGQESLDHVKGALETLRMDYAMWATNIGEALAGANLASQQLKLTTIETRRSPWKLLYRPSADELEHELLYEATRSFAVAAADLKASAEAVKRIVENHGAQIAADPETYRRLEQNLLQSLTKYEDAQQKMLDVLVSDGQR